MNELAELFARQKYAVWRSLLKDPELSLVYRYACKRAQSGTMIHDDQVPGASSAHGDFIMDGLLIDLVPEVEWACGLKVFPTYSYFREYKRGDSLTRHTDRPACEISLTVCLGYDGQEPWPIWIEGSEGVSSVALQPGDGMLYRGIECAHWREVLQDERVMQVFLHYIDQNGPYAEWKYDKRPGLPFIRSLPRP